MSGWTDDIAERIGASVREVPAKVVCKVPFCDECDKELEYTNEDTGSIAIGHHYKCPACKKIFRSADYYPNFMLVKEGA